MNGPLVSTSCNPLEPWISMGIIIHHPPKNIKNKHPKNIVLLHRSAQLQVGPFRCSVQIFAEPPVQRACNAATQASLRWSCNGREAAAPQPTSGKGTSSNQTCELQRHGSGCVSQIMRKKVHKNTQFHFQCYFVIIFCVKNAILGIFRYICRVYRYTVILPMVLVPPWSP